MSEAAPSEAGRLPVRIRIASEADVAAALRAGRALAQACGLSVVEAQHVATAVSEVATNAWRYGRDGEVVLEALERDGRRGVRAVIADRGPGIADVEAALRDGVSTGGGLGLGLPGARRLMDDFVLRSAPGSGTVVEMEKWAGGSHDERAPARWTLHRVRGGLPFAQVFRNGVLFGVAAGPRADEAAAACTAHAWRTPPELVRACGALAPLGVALASLSSLDGALAWLRAGALEAAIVRRRRHGHAVLRAPAQPALEGRTLAGLAAQTLSVVRDDVLVLAAEPLGDAQLAALAASAPALGPRAREWPALCAVRLDRGALEPRARVDRPSTLNRR